MGRTRALVLAHTRCNDPAREDDWSGWYDDVHLPDLLDAPDGPWVATRWELRQKPVPGMPSIGFSHLAIYELDGPDPAAQLQGLRARDRALRAEGRIHPNHCVIGIDALQAHGIHCHKPEPSDALRSHILAWVLCNDPAGEATWDAWVDQVHVPDMLDSGAFAAATRWRRMQVSPDRANHLTLYDIAHPSVEDAVALSAEVMPKLAARGRSDSRHVGAMVLMLVPTGRHGAAGARRDGGRETTEERA